MVHSSLNLKRLIIVPVAAFSMVAGTGCRKYQPVERHYLRVPALEAGEISGIERQRWLGNVRKIKDLRETAATEQLLRLEEETRPVDSAKAPAGDVRFFPENPGSRLGVVALQWRERGAGPGQPGRLRLLKTEGGRYRELESPEGLPVLPGHPPLELFSLTARSGAITGYRKVIPKGTKRAQYREVAVFRWSGAGGWQLERLD